MARRRDLVLIEALARCSLSLAQDLERSQNCAEFGEAVDKNLLLHW